MTSTTPSQLVKSASALKKGSAFDLHRRRIQEGRQVGVLPERSLKPSTVVIGLILPPLLLYTTLKTGPVQSISIRIEQRSCEARPGLVSRPVEKEITRHFDEFIV